MLTLGEIDALERQLKASLIALKDKRVHNCTLVEAIDFAGIWPSNGFENLAPINPKLDFGDLINRAPLFVCAVASEIGYRFEGIGTVYWAKLCSALGLQISWAQRESLAGAFESLSSKYSIARPSVSAFSAHFSIISWPIANALLPFDLIGPVGRLLARAPTGALPSSGRSPNFARLRAWASAAEGARLTDWLRFEEPTTRVLTALLTENRGAVLSDLTYRRLSDAMAQDVEALVASRAARLRARNANAPVSFERTLGWLSMSRDKSGLRMFANWPPLPPVLLDDAHATARSSGWRPRLWGAGGFLHADFALSAGPFAVMFQTVPADECPVYGDAVEVFGAGSDVAAALAARWIDWSLYLLFDPNHDRSQAEQRFGAVTGTIGFVWIAAKDGINGLPVLGKACGYTVHEANLADVDQRVVLMNAGLLSAETRPVLARHPIDAIGARPGFVSPERPFLLYRREAAEDEAKIHSLAVGEELSEIAGPLGRPGVRAATVLPFEGSIADLTLFERDSLFDALIERRLSIRVDSRLPLRKLLVTSELEIAGCLIARGRDILSTPATISASSPLLTPLYENRILAKLLEVGAGVLLLSIGRRPILRVSIKRPVSSVDWTSGIPTLLDTECRTELVSATAHHPNRFSNAVTIKTPASGAIAFGLRLDDGRIANPVQLFASAAFNLDDLAAHFGEDIGSRRRFDEGRGVGDMARARVTWAKGLCTTLPSIAAKTRIVRQFEEPLVVGLCGQSWWRAENASQSSPSDPHAALWQIVLQRGLASVPDGTTASEQVLFARSFRRHAKRLDPGWPFTNRPSENAMDDALNAAFTEALRELHLRGVHLEVTEGDYDFGSVAEDWKRASDEALGLVRRNVLVKLIAPSAGGRQLSHRHYVDVTIAELAEDLSSWTQKWALVRGQLSPDVAASAIQLWVSPSACDSVDVALRVLAGDPFVSRAVRYVALRLRSENEEERV